MIYERILKSYLEMFIIFAKNGSISERIISSSSRKSRITTVCAHTCVGALMLSWELNVNVRERWTKWSLFTFSSPGSSDHAHLRFLLPLLSSPFFLFLYHFISLSHLSPDKNSFLDFHKLVLDVSLTLFCFHSFLYCPWGHRGETTISNLLLRKLVYSLLHPHR